MTRHFVTADLMFGDQNKGTTVEFLVWTMNAGLVVRHIGGVNAAHNIVFEGRFDKEGKNYHTYNQFGCGTHLGAGTYLSKHFRFAPFYIVNEAAHLEEMGISKPLDKLWVDERCLLTLPYHEAYSMQQAPIHQRGTTGLGVGDTVRYAEQFPDAAIYAGDMRDRGLLRDKLKHLIAHYEEAGSTSSFIQSMPKPIENMMDFLESVADRVDIVGERQWLELRDQEFGSIVYEAAQGVQLDHKLGWQLPYVTSSNTTFDNAKELLEGVDRSEITWIGTCRMYATRHGEGDLPSYDPKLDRLLPEVHNVPNEFQGAMRRGWFDLDLINKSLEILGGVDYISMSHLDYYNRLPFWRIRENGTNDEVFFHSVHNFLWYVEKQTKTKIGILGSGPKKEDRHYQ